MFCDITMRRLTVLRGPPVRAQADAQEGRRSRITFYTHPEVEFFLFKDPIKPGKPPTPVDQSGYFDHTPQSLGSDFRRRAITMLEQMGISVEYTTRVAGATGD